MFDPVYLWRMLIRMGTPKVHPIDAIVFSLTLVKYPIFC